MLFAITGAKNFSSMSNTATKGPTDHPPVLHYKQKLAFLGIYTLILWFMIIFELKGVFAINHMH